MKDHDIGAMFQVFNEIGIVNQLASSLLEKNLPLGLKESQFKVLNHFVRLGDGSTPAKLATAFQVTRGAMTNTINRLLAIELIRVEEDIHDRRVKRIYLTEKGREAREQSISSTMQALAPLLQSFSLEEFKSAQPFLTKLRNYLDQNR